MIQADFINVQYLKNSTTLQDNIDDDILVPFITKAQDTHLQQTLGTTFYIYLQNEIINGTVSGDDKVLIDTYIQPMLAEWVLYEVLPHINYKLTNKAVSTNNSEWSTSSELAELKYLRQSIRDLAEFYTKRLNVYLCDYSSLFPSYENPDDKENLRKSNKSYFSGLFVPKRRSDKYYDGTRILRN